MKRIIFLDQQAQVFQGLAPRPKRHIRAALKALAGGDRALDLKPLIGFDEPKLWRLRVGSHRLVYYETAGEIVVVRVFHRRLGYDWLD